MLKSVELTSEEDKAVQVLSIGLPRRMLLKGHGGVKSFIQNTCIFGLLLQNIQYFLQMQGFLIETWQSKGNAKLHPCNIEYLVHDHFWLLLLFFEYNIQN